MKGALESGKLNMPTMGFTRLPQKDAAPVNPSPVRVAVILPIAQIAFFLGVKQGTNHRSHAVPI